MIFQILDANYAYDSNSSFRDPLVQLFGRTPEGKSVTCRVSGFRPYFYAGVDEGFLESAAEGLKTMGLEVEEVERFEPIGYQVHPKRMLKVTTHDPKEVRSLRERVREVPGVSAVYETDILFKNRFLIDRNLGGMSWVEVPIPEWVDGKIGQEGLIVSVDSLHPVEHETNAPLRFMSFDIECLPNHGEMPKAESSPVILISMAFEPEYQGQKDLVLVGKDIDCPRADIRVCQDEYDLLAQFASILRDYDPDILVGYNSNEFDFPYLSERARQLHADMRVGREGSSWYVRKIVNRTDVSITGRVVVDLLPIIRSSYSLKQYTLKNAAAELLGMEKYDVDPKEIEGLWAEGGEGLRRFISYSRRDAVLALHLLLDLRLMDKYIAMSRASGSLLQDIVNGGQSGMVENLLLRRFRERNRVVPPKPDAGISDERYVENEDLKGGAVLAPEKGLVESVVILDYKSLYPTIMMAHNLCYSTVVTHDSPQEDQVITAPSGGRFVSPKTSPGIMPGVLRELLDQRTKTKKLMKEASEEERRFLDAKQYAMKILLNSFYGYSGYARARLYSLALANAVTSFGRENILRTKKIIDDIGSIYVIDGAAVFGNELPFGKAGAKRFDLSVVYGDTDSVFVRLRPSGSELEEVSLQDAGLIGRKIAETVTASLPAPMELVFEAFARRGIFLAKKRYALWVFEPVGDAWKDRIKVRGMETVRRDWCDLTSKTLKTCLELVLKEGKVEEAVDHVRSVVLRLQDLDLSQDPAILEDLTLTRRYTKSTGSYKNKQPHIQLVEKIKKRGGHVPDIGDRVPFVIIRGRNSRKNKELFVDRAEDPGYALEKNIPLDTEYYVEKQILPPVLRIFETFGVTKDRLCIGRGQSSLFSFQADAPRAQKQKSLFDF
ncbi:MAG: DNA polymerase [Methanosaeta sp. PtaB.Bin018]|nr:DNA polymerase elongation subunit [Methanothrix sp.]OPX76693.1 MAG: DNA polymerase [Methanosaeta sp. PtaB.Bin018]